MKWPSISKLQRTLDRLDETNLNIGRLEERARITNVLLEHVEKYALQSPEREALFAFYHAYSGK